MLKISRRIAYALIALKHMNRKPGIELTSAKEICDTYKTPFDPTSRVLQIMAQNGVLKAAQGAKGGYSICKDLATVTLAELSDTITGPIQIAGCLGENPCDCDMTKTCPVIDLMADLNARIKEVFASSNVAEILKISSDIWIDERQPPLQRTRDFNETPRFDPMD